MRRLLPPPPGIADHCAPVDLADAYAYPGTERWLRANMVASADGAATAEGYSEGLSGDADKEIFFLLRSLADVVLVGAGTVRQEGYGPARPRARYAERRKAAGQAPAPVIAVVSRSLDLDFTSKLFTAAATPTIVITTATADPVALTEARSVADVILAGTHRVDLAAAVDALAERGLRRMLTEGGPHLLAQLVAAGRLDELCVTVSPLLIGGRAMRILAGGGAGAADQAPVALELAQLLEQDGFLFARYLTRPDGTARAVS